MKLSISMTRRETLLGWSYLLFSMFVLPFVIQFGAYILGLPLSDSLLNLIFFGVNFAAVVLIFRRFLSASLKAAVAAPWRSLRFALFGLVFYFVGMHLVSRGILRIYPDFSNVNDQAVSQMTQEYTVLMNLFTILLVPITEETLYRGLLFQGLQRKNRYLAYIVSTAVFASIHILAYIGIYDWKLLTLCFVQYIPAGIALAWAYEKADTIVAPILMHITINQIGISAMR